MYVCDIICINSDIYNKFFFFEFLVEGKMYVIVF